MQIAKQDAGGEIPEEIQLFFNSIKSEATKGKYKAYFKKYQHLTGLTVNDIISEKDPKKIERQIIDFINNRKNEGMNWGAIKNYVACVLAFYKINDIDLKTDKITRFMPEQTKVRKDRPYTHEEISKILEFCDERTRVIVLLLASTGMRIGAIPTLKVGNIDNSNNKITAYENTKDEYVTFCTPECKQAIDSYLDMRSRYGEKINDDSYLIREQFDIKDKFAIARCRSIARDTMQSKLKDITKRSNTRSKEVRLVHGFRKFFTNQLRKSGVPTEVRWLLEGHKLKGNDPFYVRSEDEELYQEYMKAVNNLTINEENRLKIKVELLEGEKNEMTSLKNQVNENTSMLSDLLELIKLKAENDLEINDNEDQEQVNKINSINERLSRKGIKTHKYLIPSCFEDKE